MIKGALLAYRHGKYRGKVLVMTGYSGKPFEVPRTIKDIRAIYGLLCGHFRSDNRARCAIAAKDSFVWSEVSELNPIAIAYRNERRSEEK